MRAPIDSAPRGANLERVNVNLPRPLLDDLRRLVPRARRSEVIARATARELRRLKLAALISALTKERLWRAEDHAGFATAADIDVAVKRLRTGGTLPFSSTPRPPARRKAHRE